MSFERVLESLGRALNKDVPENGEVEVCSLNIIDDSSKKKLGKTEKNTFLINAVRENAVKSSME